MWYNPSLLFSFKKKIMGEVITGDNTWSTEGIYYQTWRRNESTRAVHPEKAVTKKAIERQTDCCINCVARTIGFIQKGIMPSEDLEKCLSANSEITGFSTEELLSLAQERIDNGDKEEGN